MSEDIDESEQKKELITIDYEHIRMLKRTGHYREAVMLIEAHQESIKKNFMEGRKINTNLNLMEHRMRLKFNHKCITCGKDKENLNHVHCNSCKERHATSNKRWKQKKKGGSDERQG